MTKKLISQFLKHQQKGGEKGQTIANLFALHTNTINNFSSTRVSNFIILLIFHPLFYQYQEDLFYQCTQRQNNWDLDAYFAAIFITPQNIISGFHKIDYVTYLIQNHMLHLWKLHIYSTRESWHFSADSQNKFEKLRKSTTEQNIKYLYLLLPLNWKYTNKKSRFLSNKGGKVYDC